MTANTPAAATTAKITIGDQMWELAKGDQVRVTTTGGEVIEGTFVSHTPRGIRINSTPVGERSKYVTRKMSVVTDIELLPDGFGPAADETPAAEVAPAAPLTDAKVDDEFAALVARSTEFGHGNTAIEREMEATPAATPAAAPAAESNEDSADADYDTDPMVGGKRLSEMRFAEVMELAKKYKTPGRGVARIGALRDGVAKAISLEVGRLASAS